jgi:O-antigen ligase
VNTLAYFILVGSCLLGGALGSPVILYVGSLFLPMLQVMPTPVGAISAPVNLLLAGLMASTVTGASKRPATTGSLPLKKSLILMTVVLVSGLLIRAVREQAGSSFLNELADQPIVIWYWVTPFLVYALVWRLATDRTVAWRVVRACELSIVGEGTLTIIERALGIGRATAHIGEANRAGAYFAAGSCFMLARFLTSRGKFKVVYALAWFISMAGMFNSLSRGAMVATAFASFVTVSVFFVKGKGRAGSKVLFVVVLAILLANAVVLIPQSVVDRVNSTFRTGAGEEITADTQLDASAEARLLFWKIAWDNFKMRPMGLGTGTFPTLVEPYWKRPMNAHNIYLQLLTEYGLQGLLGLLVLIGTALGYFYRCFVRWDGTDRSDTALSLLGWWTAHCAAHAFVNPFFLIQGTGQFWIMTGCLPHLLDTIPAAVSKMRSPGGRG